MSAAIIFSGILDRKLSRRFSFLHQAYLITSYSLDCTSFEQMSLLTLTISAYGCSYSVQSLFILSTRLRMRTPSPTGLSRRSSRWRSVSLELRWASVRALEGSSSRLLLTRERNVGERRERENENERSTRGKERTVICFRSCVFLFISVIFSRNRSSKTLHENTYSVSTAVLFFVTYYAVIITVACQ